MTLHVRAGSASSDILTSIEREVRQLDPNIAVQGATSLERNVSESLFDQRFASALIGVFGLVSLVLAAIGVLVYSRCILRSAVASLGSEWRWVRGGPTSFV